MASKRISAFIAQQKLGELQVTRERLLAAYREIEDEARPLLPHDALRVLAAGLGSLKHGNGRVHPEVVNLEVTLGDPRALHERWLERLWEVVRQGRARADVISLYGGALGEWLSPTRQRHVPSEVELAELRGSWMRPSAVSTLWDHVAPRLDPERGERARALVAARCREVMDPANGVPGDPDPEILTAAGRADARSLPGPQRDGTEDPAMLELRAAFRLSWAAVGSWDWPAGGITLEPGWTGQRFRLRPRMDYLTACTVEAIGTGFRRIVEPWSGRANRMGRLRIARLEELSAPEIIIENERRALRDLPAPLDPVDDDLGAEGSIRRERMSQSAESAGGDYAYSGGRHGLLMALLWTEVEVARAADRPLHVFKTDIADFFPSVSHGLVDEVLAGLGVTPELRALVGRVLSVRLDDGTRTTRGLPLCLTVSRVLAELVVDVVVSAVRAAAPVDVYVLVDDLVIVSDDPDAIHRAREALEAALGCAGLVLNPDKTGTFGGSADGPPVQWGLLALGEAGWTLAPDPFETFLAATRTHVARQGALLDQVSAWRAQLQYLWTWLAPAAALGPRHFETVRAALDAMRTLSLPSVDGLPHEGIAALLRHELQRRFLAGEGAVVPEGWLHWPISAGGMGLPYPPADLVPLELAAAARTPVEQPSGRCSFDDPEWGGWYADRLVPLEAEQPAASPALDGFVARFVQRGARLGQASGDLSPYWRWVLTTFGPDILEAFGSFDFVATDLIPVALIRESLGGRRVRKVVANDDIPF